MLQICSTAPSCDCVFLYRNGKSKEGRYNNPAKK